MAHFGLPEKFAAFIQPGEQVLWVERPRMGLYILSSLLFQFKSGVWSLLLAPFRAVKMWYAVTDRRLLISTGLLGGGVKVIPYENDFSIEPAGDLLGTGTLKIDCGEVSSDGDILYDYMTAIPDALQVCYTIDDALREFDLHQGSAGYLLQLTELMEKGLITAKEWERTKSRFIGYPPDVRQGVMHDLQALGELHKKGVLTDSEFNMKKWDILSEKDEG